MEPARNLKIRDGPAQVTSMELVGGFTSREEAVAALREQAEEQSSLIPNSTSIRSRFEGELNGIIHGRGGELKRIIQITYDHSETHDHERCEEPSCVCQADLEEKIRLSRN